jgi:hypothetical protein
MTEAKRCPHRGAALPDDSAANAACAVCLFKLALEPASEIGEPSPDAWTDVPSSIEKRRHAGTSVGRDP